MAALIVGSAATTGRLAIRKSLGGVVRDRSPWGGRAVPAMRRGLLLIRQWSDSEVRQCSRHIAVRTSES
jgi:hypothetical protein